MPRLEQTALWLTHLLRVSIVLSVSCLFPSAHVKAQPRTLHFEPVTDRVPVRAYADRLGFVWIREHGDITLYDGFEFVPLDRFWPELDLLRPDQLPTISEVDAEGRIWLVPVGGLARSNGWFAPLEFPPGIEGRLAEDGRSSMPWEHLDIDPTNSIPTYTRQILVDRSRRVWMATSEGLIRYTPSTSNFAHYRHRPSDPGSISFDNTETVVQDSSGAIWVGTLNGLNRLEDESTERFKRYRYTPPPLTDTGNGYLEASIFAHLYVDQSGDLWAVSFLPDGSYWTSYRWQGDLLRYDPAADTLRTLFPDLDGKVTGFAQDQTGRYWIGTIDGLFTLDKEQKSLDRVKTLWARGEHLEVARGALFVDQHDILWLSSSRGLAKTDLRRQPFEYYGHDQRDPNGLTPNWIKAILMNEDGTVWLGTDYPDKGQPEGGLSLLERATGRFTHFKSDPDDHGTLSSNEINAIARKGDGRLWVATSSGLDLFDPTTGNTRRFFLGSDTLSTQPVSDVVSGKGVLSITATTTGDLWLGLGGRNGYDQGLARLSPDMSLQYYTVDADNRSLVERRGVLWIAGRTGIREYNPSTDRWELRVATDSLWQRVRGIPRMHASKQGLIWIATQGVGLWRYSPDTGALDDFHIGDRRKSEWIGCIQEDEYGFLWVSSLDGLARFDPSLGTVDRFSVVDGIQGNEFASQGCDRSVSGELAFGGADGLNVFRPRRRVTNPHPPNVFLTSILVNGRRLTPDADVRMSESTEWSQEITLAHSQNEISFEYTAIQFSHPREITFDYRLGGFDEEWRSAGTRRLATYTNLDPGSYTFTVRASSGHVQSVRGAAVRFVILAPWWTSWWAYTVYMLLFGAILYVGHSVRIRRLRARSLELEELVAVRTHDLDEEKRRTEEQARRLVELDAAKNRLFANISHEFRTPITLILGPLQDLLDGLHGRVTDQAQRQIEVMRQNAERLLKLVTQLLDLSKLDARQMEIHRENVEVVGHLDSIVQSFVPAAERKRIDLSFSPEIDELACLSDPDMLEKVVGNLISNAIKFTPEEGDVLVTIRYRGSDSGLMVEILVKDTGPGIPKDELAKIFDRFASFDKSSGPVDSWARSHEGLGLGLALARELVELHGGIILVESVPGLGATFTVRLPLEPTVPATSGLKIELEVPVPLAGETDDGCEIRDRSRPRILVVDDNGDVRDYIRRHLEGDYDIVEAGNGLDGLEVAREAAPDLILADVMMPVMDGYELCRSIKSHERLGNTPVIILTAKAGDESTLEGLESGADEYVSKPFSMPELKARIANLIESRRRMRTRFSREIVVQPAGITIESEDEAFLKRVIEVIESRLGDANFGVEWLADELAVSPRHLRRKVEAVTGEPPAELIRRMRLERASQLLEYRAGPVAEVAYKVGFKSVSHFSTAFKDKFGISPSEWS